MGVVAKSDYSVTINGGKIRIPGTWSERTGGRKQREIANHFQGDNRSPDLIVGKTTGDDMTLTRGFDPKVDDAWVTQLFAAMEKDECVYTITQTPRTRSGTVYGKPRSWPNVPVKSINLPEAGNGESADVSMIELVFATRGPGSN